MPFEAEANGSIKDGTVCTRLWRGPAGQQEAHQKHCSGNSGHVGGGAKLDQLRRINEAPAPLMHTKKGFVKFERTSKSCHGRLSDTHFGPQEPSNYVQQDDWRAGGGGQAAAGVGPAAPLVLQPWAGTPRQPAWAALAAARLWLASWPGPHRQPALMHRAKLPRILPSSWR